MSVALRAEHLVRTLPGEVPTTLVDDVNLDIAAGEFVAIMGPSGSGKSSLLYLLGLLDVPTRGEVWLEGRATARLRETELAALRLGRLGFVFQFHFLLAEFSAIDNVALPMRKLGALRASAITARARQLLADLGLAEHSHKRPHQLSGGQRQRVAIARALANDPPIVLADEPTGNLDSASSATVREILHELTHRRGKTVVTVTHDAAFARAADRIVRIVDGKIAQGEPPAP